jgi:hypothetical protein
MPFGTATLTSSPQNYHSHMLLLSGITDLLRERRMRGFRTTLHKIRAHTIIRGMTLQMLPQKMAVTQHDFLPESQTLKVDVGKIPPRPPHWIMHIVRLPLPPTRLGADTRMATLRQPWWSIPEGECTLSRAPHNNFDEKSDMRSYAASTILPYIAA